MSNQKPEAKNQRRNRRLSASACSAPARVLSFDAASGLWLDDRGNSWSAIVPAKIVEKIRALPKTKRCQTCGTWFPSIEARNRHMLHECPFREPNVKLTDRRDNP